MSQQCKEIISIRDMLRYSGRGRGGFTMHYERRQCHRIVKPEDTHCWQHRQAAGRPAGQEQGEA